MNTLNEIKFIDNATIGSRHENYTTVFVDVPTVLKSWQSSLFSFQWLQPDGQIKDIEALPEEEQPKRQGVEEKLSSAAAIEQPILGIGLMENIEIGAGRAEFLTLAAKGVPQIPVHIPKSNESDFKEFLAAID
ncbi:MAG: hypothetical protein DHS20C02_13740 [Micavibrio sp.]|nr:MAG: hypothetical protein DHS20C02_13740 [Micavibrio sp.]